MKQMLRLGTSGWSMDLMMMKGTNAGLGASYICIFSYNSQGFNTVNKEFIQKLVSVETVGNKKVILC